MLCLSVCLAGSVSLALSRSRALSLSYVGHNLFSLRVFDQRSFRHKGELLSAAGDVKTQKRKNLAAPEKRAVIADRLPGNSKESWHMAT